MPAKLLLLLTDLQIGGTPTVVRELAIRLAPHAGVHVACLARDGPVAGQLRGAGISVTTLNAAGSADLLVLPRLIELIHREKFDAVLSFLLHANAAAAFARPFCSKTRFFQAIQTTQPTPRWHWTLQRVIHHAAEKIIVPSPSVADFCALPAGKIQIIPNAVALEDFAGITPPGASRIGFLGRLDPVKRIPDLIDALPLIALPATLHIFGQGAQEKSLRDHAARLDLASRITFHGSVPTPRTALGQIDILVLPSQTEGFGLVLIEAMAAGIPIVATDVPGIRDVIHPNQTGLLVPPQSPSLLAAAVTQLLADGDLRRRLTAAARAAVAEHYAWEKILPQYLALLLPENS